MSIEIEKMANFRNVYSCSKLVWAMLAAYITIAAVA